MHRFSILLLATTAALGLGACSDDSSEGSPNSGGTAGSGNSSGSGGATGGSGGTPTGGMAGTSAGGSAGQSTGGSAGAATGGSGGGTSCTSATETLLGTIDKVSDGVIEIIDDQSGAKTLYIDASAGGFTQAAQNPYIYLDLAGGTKVSVTDPASLTTSTWDLALKRDVIRTNSADSGPGSGGAARITGKSFDAITAADATGVTFETDDFMDDECNALTDQTGKPLTAFTEWYDYEPTTMHLTPKDIVFVVKAANGTALYKLQISNYYAAADGGTGAASAFYSVQVAPL